MSGINLKKDVHLDAIMVHSAMINLFESCAIQLGMTPDEAFGRALWLKRQSSEYIQEVCDAVAKLEKA